MAPAMTPVAGEAPHRAAATATRAALSGRSGATMPEPARMRTFSASCSARPARSSPRPTPGSLPGKAPPQTGLRVERRLHPAVGPGPVRRHHAQLLGVLEPVEDHEVRDDPAVAQDEVVHAVDRQLLAGRRDAQERPGVAALQAPLDEDVVVLGGE